MPLTAIQEGDSDRDGRGEWERDGVKERRKEECEGGVREGGREKSWTHNAFTEDPYPAKRPPHGQGEKPSYTGRNSLFSPHTHTHWSTLQECLSLGLSVLSQLLVQHLYIVIFLLSHSVNYCNDIKLK